MGTEFPRISNQTQKKFSIFSKDYSLLAYFKYIEFKLDILSIQEFYLRVDLQIKYVMHKYIREH